MRKPLIAGNWKLNNPLAKAVSLAERLKIELADIEDADIVIAPVFTVLNRVSGILSKSNISVSAQNCYPEKSGAFTGEISPALLKSAGCQYTIVGHSERRELFAESDAFINLKIKALQAEKLVPIFCIGETLSERDEGQMFAVLRRQIEGGLKDLDGEAATKVVIAYEPVWAIGTGKTATSAQANEAHAFIRSLVSELFGQAVADQIRIIYGGSVKPGSIDDLMAQEHVDGALVGGASLKADDFIRIARFKRD